MHEARGHESQEFGVVHPKSCTVEGWVLEAPVTAGKPNHPLSIDDDWSL